MSDDLAPSPSIDVTYRLANGDPVNGEYGWVDGTESFDDEGYPVELVEEKWKRVAVRKFWHLPTTLYDCDVDWCDEDAVGWVQQPSGTWSQRCSEHTVPESEWATAEDDES